MSDFFNSYLNIKKIREEKRAYRQQMERVKTLPADYRFVYEKIQKYMWNFAAGDGYDMLKVQYDLIELFETGAAEGQPVLAVTGEDVAAFCDELLRNAKTYADAWRKQLNRDVMNKLGQREEPK